MNRRARKLGDKRRIEQEAIDKDMRNAREFADRIIIDTSVDRKTLLVSVLCILLIIILML